MVPVGGDEKKGMFKSQDVYFHLSAQSGRAEQLTHEEVTSGEGEEGEEGQWVLKGDGVLHC